MVTAAFSEETACAPRFTGLAVIATFVATVPPTDCDPATPPLTVFVPPTWARLTDWFAANATRLVVPGVVWSIPTLPMTADPATRTGAVAMETGCVTAEPSIFHAVVFAVLPGCTVHVPDCVTA